VRTALSSPAQDSAHVCATPRHHLTILASGCSVNCTRRVYACLSTQPCALFPGCNVSRRAFTARGRASLKCTPPPCGALTTAQRRHRIYFSSLLTKGWGKTTSTDTCRTVTWQPHYMPVTGLGIAILLFTRSVAILLFTRSVLFTRSICLVH
jgi:hypothetical protein